jgi:site-specific recombinase XerD
MKHTVNFYLDKKNSGKGDNTPIYLFVSFGGKRIKYYTGERCTPKQWVDSKDGDKVQRVKRNNITPAGDTATNINSRLEKIESEVARWFAICEQANETPTTHGLRKALDLFTGKNSQQCEETTSEPTFFDRYEQYLSDGLFSPNRKKKLQTTLNKIEAWRPKTTFEDMTVQFVTDFQKFLVSDHGLSRNAAISELKCLRAFLNYSIKHGWNTNYPFNSFSIEAEAYGDPVFITVEERDLLYNANIENESLARVRDMFVFQCLIGCRISDLTKLKKSNIINGCIEYIAGKTKDNKPRVARIPLTEKAKAILAKYDLPNGDLLPYISHQKYNDYIKDVFALVKLTRMVTIPDPKTRVNIQKPLNELASSHMARRVFVGSLYSKGVKNEIIGSMSGHVDGSKAFARYYNIDVKDQQAAVNLIE